MLKPELAFPWSDNWHIENDKAYFCAAEMNALFCADLNSQAVDLIDSFPEFCTRDYRAYSYCFKCGSIVFCLPNRGKDILCYDTRKLEWDLIEIENRSRIMGCLFPYTQYNNEIWLQEDQSGRMIEVDLLKKSIKKECYIPQFRSKFSGQYTLVEKKIFVLSGHEIFCIDINKITVYEITNVKAELYTICYDGLNFWLSGFAKEIYIWNPEQGVIRTLINFPDQFSLYRFGENDIGSMYNNSFFSENFPFFSDSIFINGNVWFFPFQSNEVLYINKESYSINVLEIEEEQENRETLQRVFSIKYIVEYIRDDRYIGVYSIKNQKIFEIDTVEYCVINKKYRLSKKAILDLALNGYSGKRLYENDKIDNYMYSILLYNRIENISNSVSNIGKVIYEGTS